MSEIMHKNPEFGAIRYDEWGERTTLLHSLDKQIATLKALCALESIGKGAYQVQKQVVKSSETVKSMIQTKMMVDGKAYYSFQELSSSDYMFPFIYVVEKKAILTDGRFSLNNFGGNLSVSLNR